MTARDNSWHVTMVRSHITHHLLVDRQFRVGHQIWHGSWHGFLCVAVQCYPFTPPRHIGQYQSGSMLHRDQYHHSHKTQFSYKCSNCINSFCVVAGWLTKKCRTNVDKRQSGWLHLYFSFGCIAVTEIINLAPILSWSDSEGLVELTKPWEASGHFAQFNIFYLMTTWDRKYRPNCGTKYFICKQTDTPTGPV